MVFGVPFQCDMCGTVIRLKIQADNSLYSYEYPVSVICPKCGNILEFRYTGKNGILPRDYKVAEDTKTEYDFYYSAFLPVATGLYMRPSEQIGFTPFMELGMHYLPENIVGQNYRGNLFLKHIYPFRTVFKDVLPIYRKGNVAGYSKKIAKIFDLGKRFTPITDIKICRKNLLELLECTYKNLAPDKYVEGIVTPFLLETLDIAHMDGLKAPYVMATNIVNYNQWQNSSFDFIANMVAKFEKYIPSLFYCTVGDFKESHNPPMNVYTISLDEAITDYDISFNLIKELLPLIVSLSNHRLTDHADVFPNKDGGMKGIETVKEFYELPDGLKIDKLQDYPEIVNFLAGGFNTKIRNGIGHRRYSLVDDTQNVQFYYKQNNLDEYYDVQLVDLCYLTIINLLHIMEFVLLIEKLKR